MLPFKKSNFFLLGFALILSSCGYHTVGGQSDADKTLVSIPLIRDDDDGILRNCIARSISESGKFRYSSDFAPCELIVAFENSYTDTIGYEWDVNAASGQEVSRLYPDEGRRTVVALITLRDAKTKDPILKPFKISVRADYDFVNPVAKKDIEFKDFFGNEHTTLQYSLGQLDSEEGAKVEAGESLYRQLAGKIVDVLGRAPRHKREKNEGV